MNHKPSPTPPIIILKNQGQGMNEYQYSINQEATSDITYMMETEMGGVVPKVEYLIQPPTPPPPELIINMSGVKEVFYIQGSG